ncbi:DUF397 domain-containing protein [Streptomyces sp. NBC_01187]|uniref:DUF397 domain-containing protein n=1 Tax=Streptomyces sp. NBC_01187 TaxID=2903766 RepID=UPI0038672DB6|nr:DUF397 domain-containing protein [Streptomyces sp. NBC_01187]
MTTNACPPTSLNFADVNWFKSSYSGNGNNCVEVADLTTRSHAGVAIRDSKAPENPALLVALSGWSSFVSALKGGDFSA